MSNQHNQLPEIGFVRLNQIIGDKKSGILPIIPVCRTAWLMGVKNGIYPKPIKIGSHSVAWRVEDIRALVEALGAQE
jgi:prophage regulatory protein